MIAKVFDQIEKADIDALITNKVSEHRTLEYKLALPTEQNEEKKEFLADVSSFANASGGDILYGIDEERDPSNKPTGSPKDAPGLTVSKNLLENWAQGVESFNGFAKDCT